MIKIKEIIIYVTIFSISIFSMIPFTRAQYKDQVELISLDLKGMDIRDVLKILSQKSGLNIVADKDVKGTVALYIKDVDVMNALDIIVSTNDLAYEQEGTLIRVMTDRQYERLHGEKFADKTITEIIKLDYANTSEVSKALTKMKSKIGNIIPDDASGAIVLIDNPTNIQRMKHAVAEMDVLVTTEVFSLDYAKAEEIKGNLEQILSKNVGTIRFDERTNKVIVKDTPKKIEDIRKVIEAFDEKTREVVIDANIIQVTLSDKYSYGIDWADIAGLGDLRLTSDTNLTTALTGTTPSTLTIATTGGNYATIISLLQTFGETNVLSRPRITVADKEEAKILVGAKEVYVTSEVTTTSGGTYHTTDHVQFVDVGVALTVTPIINRSGFVTMKIKPEVSTTDATKTVQLTNPDGSTRTIVPYVTTSEADTTVVVKDNTTLIIGGLMKDTVVDYKEKVPFLGDIPLLGKLFSTSGKSKEKTELVIFLTPHIIEGNKTTDEARLYVDEWQKKKDASGIEKPEESKSNLPKSFEAKKKQVKKLKPKKTLWSSFFGSQTKTKKSPVPISTEGSFKKPTPNMKRPEGMPIFSSQPEIGKKSDTVAAKTPYEKYCLAIREEIDGMVARQDVSGLNGEVELQFTLDKDGFITRGPIVLNKPDLELVRAAVNCVKKVSPFPPFPKAMEKEEAEFYVVVRYE